MDNPIAYPLTRAQRETLHDWDAFFRINIDDVIDDVRTMDLECEVRDREKELEFVNEILANLKSIRAGMETPAPA